jgi:NAD(P)-dependent dehydrogenase (short-subunit alcohol dehydrogenase family)
MTIALPDVVAVVTGAAGGIGREVVRAMSAAGAIVIATDLQDGGGIDDADRFLKHDVTSDADWAAVEALVRERHGRLDALVNTAGFLSLGKFEETPLSEFHKVNAVNLDSAIIGTQILLGLLKAGGQARPGGASVVNFSSIGGIRGASFAAAYNTSKAAVGMLSKCLGAEFAALGYNIRVNSIHPGGVHTPMLGKIVDRAIGLGGVSSRESVLETMRLRHPIGRLARPDEISGGVVFLCSEAASFMTCDELVMDGGFTQV